MNKELKSAAKLGNKPKVTRLKDTISLLEAEGNSYTDKKKSHEKELNALQERCKQLDKKIFASGITQLPFIEERGWLKPQCNIICILNPLTVKKWKAEQDKCFDNPDTGQFHSNISKT